MLNKSFAARLSVIRIAPLGVLVAAALLAAPSVASSGDRNKPRHRVDVAGSSAGDQHGGSKHGKKDEQGGKNHGDGDQQGGKNEGNNDQQGGEKQGKNNDENGNGDDAAGSERGEKETADDAAETTDEGRGDDEGDTVDIDDSDSNDGDADDAPPAPAPPPGGGTQPPAPVLSPGGGTQPPTHKPPTGVPPSGTTTTTPSTAIPAHAAVGVTIRRTVTCASRRRFVIHIRQRRSARLRSATITVNGKLVRRVRGASLSAPITLTGLPRGVVVVRIRAVTRSGRVLHGKRTYHPCTRRRRPSIPVL